MRALAGDLASNSEVLAEVRGSMSQNIATMQDNIRAVNSKISGGDK